MKFKRFKIKDLGLKRRYIYFLLPFFIYFSLIFNLTSSILHPIVFADDMGQTKTKNVAMSAILYPQPPDYQFSLAQQDGGTSVNNGKYYAYTITYGAKQSASFTTTNTTITFDLSQALAPNGQNMFDYVYGSASDAYNHVKPVVDLGKRTITWNIPTLPPGTIDQKLVFQLFTNSYDKPTGSFPLYLTTSMSNDFLTMPDVTLTNNYQYQAPPPGPTATPAPQPTSVPSPIPTPEIPLSNVSINGITATFAVIQIATQNPSKLTVTYGTSPDSLGQSMSTDTYQDISTVTLKNLKPDTTYYFRIKITGEDGSYYISEIFTFHTATQALPALPLNGTAVISANGSVLLSEPYGENMTPGFVLLTSGFPYDVTVSLPQNAAIKALESIAQQQLPVNILEMTPQQNGIYTAHMPTLGPDMYSVIIKSLDDSGTLIEHKIADLKIIPPLSVSDQQSGKAIENARIFLSYFDKTANAYKPVQANAGYTDANGVFAVNLPPGRYRAETSALLYDTATVDFTLGKDTGETFPHITLQKDPANISALFTVGKDFLVDNLIAALAALHAIATSSRVFSAVATTTTGSLVLLSYLLFLLKSHTSLKYLPLLFFIHLDVILQKHTGRYLFGKVTDENGLPLSLVRIEIEDADTKTIIKHTTTNKSGKFYFLNNFADPINLIFVKEGYQPESRALPPGGFPEKGLSIILEKGTPHHYSLFVLLARGIKDALGMLFETALVLSIILEIVFFFSYGFARTAPFFVLSIINIVLWLFYLRQRSAKSVV